MTDKQPESLFLAELLEQAAGDYTAWDKKTGYAAADELRRLREANEAFGKRQEWWNERMFELEKQREELLEALKLARLMLIAHGETHAKIDAAIAKVKGEKK